MLWLSTRGSTVQSLEEASSDLRAALTSSSVDCETGYMQEWGTGLQWGLAGSVCWTQSFPSFAQPGAG